MNGFCGKLAGLREWCLQLCNYNLTTPQVSIIVYASHYTIFQFSPPSHVRADWAMMTEAYFICWDEHP